MGCDRRFRGPSPVTLDRHPRGHGSAAVACPLQRSKFPHPPTRSRPRLTEKQGGGYARTVRARGGEGWQGNGRKAKGEGEGVGERGTHPHRPPTRGTPVGNVKPGGWTSKPMVTSVQLRPNAFEKWPSNTVAIFYSCSSNTAFADQPSYEKSASLSDPRNPSLSQGRYILIGWITQTSPRVVCLETAHRRVARFGLMTLHKTWIPVKIFRVLSPL